MSDLRMWRNNHVQNLVRRGSRTADARTIWEPKDRHFHSIQVGEDGYGKRGDTLIVIMDDWPNVDVTRTHPSKDTIMKASQVARA